MNVRSIFDNLARAILFLLIFIIGFQLLGCFDSSFTQRFEINAGNQQGTFHPWAGYRNTPGFQYSIGNWTSVIINEHGWRGPSPKKKRLGSYRCLLLGDSVAFSGWGIREGRALHGALKRKLEKMTQREWDVINMAVGGGFSSVSLGTLTHEGIHLEPDVVVLLSGHNDLLILNEKFNFITSGENNTFQSVIYHTSQKGIESVYDPRIAQIKSTAAHTFLKNQIYFVWKLTGLLQKIYPYTHEKFETKKENLRFFKQNVLSMQYLCKGKNINFIFFHQPYLSKRKKITELDKLAIKNAEKTNGPKYFAWLEQANTILREEMVNTVQKNNLNYIDLSLLFLKDESVFADEVHMLSTHPDSMPGNEILAERMASEILTACNIPVKNLLKIDSAPDDWNEEQYLKKNPSVVKMILEKKFKSGFEHYQKQGFFERMVGGFAAWDEQAYITNRPEIREVLAREKYNSAYEYYLAGGPSFGLSLNWNEETYLYFNPEVQELIDKGVYTSGQDHFAKSGCLAGKTGGFTGWDEEGYLLQYPDVRNDVASGRSKSGFEHFVKLGKQEGRNPSFGNYLKKQ
jgi:lysophospholipase L1-like esterase